MESSSPISKSLLRMPLLIAPFFLWGTAMVAMKGVIPNTDPYFLATMRLAPAGVLVLAAAFLMGRSFHIPRQGWLWITLFALVDGTLFQGFLAQGLVRTGAGLGSVMIDSQPLAVALMARWLFKEQVGPLGWLGLFVGLVGIGLLGLPDAWLIDLFQGNFTLSEIPADGLTLLRLLFDQGEWLMLMAALSMAVGTILIRYVAQYADPVVATGWHMIFGGLPLAVLSYLYESQPWNGLDGSGWGAIAYSTILGSAIAYGIFFYLAAQGNLTSLSALTFLTPVFALIFGNIFLGEVLTQIQTMGVALTIVSIYLINQRDVITAFMKRKLDSLDDTAIESNPDSLS